MDISIKEIVCTTIDENEEGKNNKEGDRYIKKKRRCNGRSHTLI
jgi:hypothetical protein